MKIELPEKVKTVIGELKAHGYDAYAVGGCIRDSILGRTPGDWDITTSAKPQQVKAIFPRTVDTGIQHGTVTVLMDKEGFEVTTYRIDGEYEDARHPKDVIFTSNLLEDLKRRDFTINAMAYNDETGLVDAFDGIADLKATRIRCVGEPTERFTEDALRMMRAVRFAAQLGFTIEDATRQAICDMAENLSKISAERIQVELVKMLVSPNPGLLALSYELGITKVVLPEFDEMMRTGQETPHHMYSVGMHTLKAVEQVRADKVLRLTMLLHDVAKPQMKTVDADGVAHFKMHDVKGAEVAKRILKRLKFDNDTLGKVTKLVQYHDYRMPAQPKNVRRAMNKIGEELFPYYLEIRKADTMAQSEYMREEKLSNIAGIERCYKEILKKKECVSLKMLAVSGSDLIADGMQPGKQIGAVLQALLELVIEQPEYNTKEILLEQSRKLRKETLL